jgi:hypothetical protein
LQREKAKAIQEEKRRKVLLNVSMDYYAFILSKTNFKSLSKEKEL